MVGRELSSEVNVYCSKVARPVCCVVGKLLRVSVGMVDRITVGSFRVGRVDLLDDGRFS